MNRLWKLLLCAAVALALAAPVMAGNGAVRGGPLTVVPKPGQPAAPRVYNSMSPPAGHVLALQWTPGEKALNAMGPNILVLCDDFTHGGAISGYPLQALQWLGLPYTVYADQYSFLNALLNQKWDLVIFASENAGPSNSAVYDALYQYVSCGGKLIAHCWAMDWTEHIYFASLPDYSNHPLWAALGVYSTMGDFGNGYGGVPDPVYWWSPADPIFNIPNSVPQLTVLNTMGYAIFGQHLGVLPGFEALAGYTMAPAAGEAAIVVGNEGRTIFRGFADAMGGADQDTDGIPDHVELWTNLITAVMDVPDMFDAVYVDDAGLSKLCLNTTTGEFIYRVLSGKGAGEYAGVATITWRPNGSFVLSGERGARYALSVYHDSQQDLVKGYYRNFDSGANSSITDKNASLTEANCCP